MSGTSVARLALRLVGASIAVGLVLAGCRDSGRSKSLETVTELGLPKLTNRVITYHSVGGKARAEKLEADIADMAAFYRERLGTQVDVTVAVLNPQDWARVNPGPYGLPGVYGDPPLIFMPAAPGGMASQFMQARKDAIPPEILKAYLQANNTSFEVVAEDFVDLIGFHELGHALCERYGINRQCKWLDEFVASYFAYAFISEQRPELKRVFDLLGRPSYRRPNTTSLADFEQLYDGVDDFGWYHGMFEAHIRDLYPRMGIGFLEQLKASFPSQSHPVGQAAPALSSDTVLDKLEAFAPGFKAWAEGFGK